MCQKVDVSCCELVLCIQGDISSPLYFDFISAMQFVTIEDEMKTGKQVFREYCEECEGDDKYKLVSRDPQYQDNALLPSVFARLLGDSLLQKCFDLEGFSEKVMSPRADLTSVSTRDLIEHAKKLLEYLVGYCGYAVGADLVSTGPNTFTARIDGPANLWALQYLSSKGSTLLPSYEAFLMDALFRRGNRVATVKSSWSKTSVVQEWTIA